jgi:thiamine biosynthesis lipoprotein
MSEIERMKTQNFNSKNPVARRDFLKIVAISGLAVGLGTGITRRWLEMGPVAAIEDTRFLMGTLVHLTLYTPDTVSGQEALQSVYTEMERLVAIFDHRRLDSPLARLNQAGKLENSPSELVEVIRYACQFGDFTGGAFDISVKPVLDALQEGQPVSPKLKALVDYRNIIINTNNIRLLLPGMAITLDGLAKGRVIDAAVKVLRNAGYPNVLVEAGGDLSASGSHGDGMPWEIGIRNPRAGSSGDLFTTIQINKRAMATSGDYQNSFSPDFQQNHIIDPGSGDSPQTLASASVLASNAMEADALSTSLMVLGPQNGLALVNRLSSVEALLIGKDLTSYRSPGFPFGS